MPCGTLEAVSRDRIVGTTQVVPERAIGIRHLPVEESPDEISLGQGQLVPVQGCRGAGQDEREDPHVLGLGRLWATDFRGGGVGCNEVPRVEAISSPDGVAACRNAEAAILPEVEPDAGAGDQRTLHAGLRDRDGKERAAVQPGGIGRWRSDRWAWSRRRYGRDRRRRRWRARPSSSAACDQEEHHNEQKEGLDHSGLTVSGAVQFPTATRGA